MADAAASSRSGRGGVLRSCLERVLSVLDMTSLQTLQYVAFLYVFQSLVGAFHTVNMRYFTKFIEDTFTDNTFDANHNTFDTVRRVADIYEWTNTARPRPRIGPAPSALPTQLRPRRS